MVSCNLRALITRIMQFATDRCAKELEQHFMRQLAGVTGA